MTALRSCFSVLLAAVVVAVGSPAFADAPDSPAWPVDPHPRTAFENLVFFGGAIVGLFLLVTLFAVLISRNNFVPEPPEPSTDVEAHGHH